MESTMTDAMHACDTVVKSGNSVLDTVLAEKKLLAEDKQIPISCVADGKLLEEGTPQQIFGNPQNPRLQDFLNKVL